jgi:hypothetical protein
VQEFELAKREAEGSGEFIRGSGRFALTAVGDLNTYALFAEHFLKLIGPDGRAGLIVPTGIATDNSTKGYFDEISSKARLVSLLDFENRNAIFPGVHRSYKFALLTLGQRAETTDYAFCVTTVNHLADQRRHFTLSPDDVALINPNTRTCPIFRSQIDAELTKEIYKRVPALIEEKENEQNNPWEAKLATMFHMTNDSHLFLERPGPNHIPLYEAKMTSFYNHRAASYASRGGERGYRVLPESTIEELQNPYYSAEPFYWVAKDEANKRLHDKGWEKDWIIGFSDITSATNERTFVCTLLPRVAAGNKLPFLLAGVTASRPVTATVLLANLSSLPFDFIVRQKVGGVTLNFFLVKQFPVLPPSAYDSTAISFIHPRVLELTYTSHDLQPWAQDLGYDGPPFIFDPERRAILRAELDAYYAHLYGLTRDEMRYILDPADLMGPDYPSETFRVLKNNEIRQFGEYRTQRLVLEAWDRLYGS